MQLLLAVVVLDTVTVKLLLLLLVVMMVLLYLLLTLAIVPVQLAAVVRLVLVKRSLCTRQGLVKAGQLLQLLLLTYWEKLGRRIIACLTHDVVVERAN
jgi:hypothetical protein